eukprot:CAMPEP_0196736672 /NCGR_PEP_ID=MMETSP1091-20130531/14664_1 /TAXON_ID=302021 /ORGANISM="Rhodomonas sp., Strain CCMP768" /LENGTH=141 /DNA_ID=CAMNT_0042080441 /DNA_START=121 /DNA_END=544 /DNA_ORIENTATION=-
MAASSLSATSTNVLVVPALFVQLLHVLLGFAALEPPQEHQARNQRLFDLPGHAGGAADVDVSAALEEVQHARRVVVELVLHVHLPCERVGVPAEGQEQVPQRAGLHPALHLVGIHEVLALPSAPEEEHVLTERRPRPPPRV